MFHLRGIVVFVLLLVPVCALGAVGVSVQCDGGEIDVWVTVFNDEMPAEMTGIVVERSIVGACDTETIITPEPLPIPEIVYTQATYNLTDTYETEGVFQVYKVWATNEAGDLLPVGGMGTPGTYDFAACGEALATRGHLTVVSLEHHEMLITECPDFCWLGCWGQGNLSFTPEMFEALLPYATGQIPVDIYGVLDYYGMPGPNCVEEITRFEPTQGGLCGPVPNDKRSWGGVKAIYR